MKTANVNETPEDKVTRAEIKLATFLAEHNIAFNTCDHLLDLLKDIGLFPDSATAQKMSLKRLKSTYVINELGKISQGEIIKDLKCNKTCAVVVKYFDKERESMETRLLDLLNIYNSDINEGEGSTGNTFSIF